MIICQSCNKSYANYEFDFGICEDCNNNIREAILQEDRDRREKDKKVLDELFSTLSKEQIEFIECEIEESEGGIDFEIVNSHPNLDIEIEAENDNEFNVWVDQSVGACGDDYYGYVYVEIIPNEKYLKWYYSM